MSRRGFSVTELLVIMAVVALLSALLLGTVSSSKQRLLGVTCMNNMRQLGSGFSAYFADNDLRKPPLKYSKQMFKVAWTNTYTKEDGKPTGLGLLFGSYFKGYEIALCPGKSKNYADYELYRWREPTENIADCFYVYEWFYPGSWRLKKTGTDYFEQIRSNNQDGRNALLMDVNIRKRNSIPSYMNHERISLTNVLYLDGRVSQFSFEDHYDLAPKKWNYREVLRMWRKAHELYSLQSRP